MSAEGWACRPGGGVEAAGRLGGREGPALRETRAGPRAPARGCAGWMQTEGRPGILGAPRPPAPPAPPPKRLHPAAERCFLPDE